jgi:hypothetical protein
MSDLHLHVNTEYFKAIKCGEKTEEYREVNLYWHERFFDRITLRRRSFSRIIIHNAYKSGTENRIVFPWHGWTLKTIKHPHFGPDEVTVFAIKLEK